MNHYDVTSAGCTGYTSKGENFYFDRDDIRKVVKHTWHVNSNGYVTTNVSIGHKKQKVVSLHRYIMDEHNPTVFIDHINGNTLDNRKSNLRRVNSAQNSQNHKKLKTNTSGTTGVYWHKNKNKWESCISVDGKNVYLGLFDSKEEAIEARKEAEEKYYGEYVRR